MTKIKDNLVKLVENSSTEYFRFIDGCGYICLYIYVPSKTIVATNEENYESKPRMIIAVIDESNEIVFYSETNSKQNILTALAVRDMVARCYKEISFEIKKDELDLIKTFREQNENVYFLNKLSIR